jgi:hypothetical protein
VQPTRPAAATAAPVQQRLQWPQQTPGGGCRGSAGGCRAQCKACCLGGGGGGGGTSARQGGGCCSSRLLMAQIQARQQSGTRGTLQVGGCLPSRSLKVHNPCVRASTLAVYTASQQVPGCA